jgi:class 3 adenylate cyclase/tetratricopeptide (TPR) repeat protein
MLERRDDDQPLRRVAPSDHLLDPYIPHDRRISLARGEPLPDRGSGAALFADISGFTALGEELVERLGPQRGAEELTRRVNDVLTGVIQAVRHYGGSAINFPGDGVTCWFDGDDGRRGVAAALTAQRRRQQTVGGGFSVKLGVTAGLARRFLVGDPRIQLIDVIAGGIVDRMAAAEELARPGEVLVGSEVVGWLHGLAEITEWRRAPHATAGEDERGPAGESFAVVAGSPDALSTRHTGRDIPVVVPAREARQWVIPVILQRLVRGRGEFISELRPVVTLFNRFSGIRYDLEDDGQQRLDRYIRWAQNVLIRYDAFILQVTVGDKGSYFYSAFGAPLSHEDDADRALKAALELREIPEELRYIDPPRIGVSQGKVLAGAYGAADRRTYGVLGRAANAAARLMEAARPGQVLVDPDVAEITSSRYLFDAGTEAAALVRERAAPQVLVGDGHRSTERVGRTTEWRSLVRSLDLLVEGHDGLVLIDGAAGTGKSRLLADLKREAEAEGVPVFAGSGRAIERNTPFYAWRTVVRRALGLKDETDPAAIRTAVENQLGDDPRLVRLAPLLNSVLLVDLPETRTTEQMPPEVRSRNTLDVLLACLDRRTTAREMAVLLLDDAQWLDSASWALLERVRASLPQFLIVAAARPPGPQEPEGAGLLELRREVSGDPDRHLVLGPLADDEIAELAAAYLGVDEVPHQLRDVLFERAEGNPFYTEELLRALQSRRLVIVEGDQVVVEGTVDQLRAEFPEGIERHLISRLDQLAPSQQALLLVASILARTFTASMLREIAPPDLALEDVEEELAALVTSEILTRTEEQDRANYEFRNSLVRQAATEILPPSWRREIHVRAARWIEERHAGALAPWYSVLAHHWDDAGDVARAIRYLDLAASHAFASSAFEEAIRLYQRLLELAVEHDSPSGSLQLGRWHLRLGEVHVHQQEEDATGGRHHLEEGLRLLGERVPRSAAYRAVVLLWQVLTHIVHQVGLRRSPRDELRRETLLEASRAFERLVEVYYISGESTLSLYAAFRALNLAESVGHSSELARGLATVGAILGFIPLPRLAERYLARALHMVDETADPSAAAWISLVAAFYQAGRGQWEDSDRLAGAWPLERRVVELSRRIGDARRIEDGLANLMIQSYLRGRFTEGLALSDRLREMAEARDVNRPLAYALQGRAYCLLDSGRIVEARKAIVQLENLLAEDAQFADQALADDAVGLLALAEARAGRETRATQLAESLLGNVSQRSPSNYSALAAYTAPVEVFLVDWRVRGYRRSLDGASRRAFRVLKRYAHRFPIGRPRLHLWRGVQARLRGRARRAERHLRMSVRTARELGLRFDEARALLELSVLLGVGSEEGDEALVEGQRLLGELGVGTLDVALAAERAP